MFRVEESMITLVMLVLLYMTSVTIPCNNTNVNGLSVRVSGAIHPACNLHSHTLTTLYSTPAPPYVNQIYAHTSQVISADLGESKPLPSLSRAQPHKHSRMDDREWRVGQSGAWQVFNTSRQRAPHQTDQRPTKISKRRLLMAGVQPAVTAGSPTGRDRQLSHRP